LGVKDLRKKNALACKWWWNLDNQDNLLENIFKAKYLRNKFVASVEARLSDFPSWKALLQVKDTYFCGS
jgi:hypothetical protein